MARNGKILLLLAAVFLIRPTALGQSFTMLGMVLAGAAGLIHLMDCRGGRTGKRIELTAQNGIVLVVALLLYAYLLMQGMLLDSIGLANILKAALAHAVILFFGAFILSDREANLRFFRWFVYLLLGFIGSYYITMLLSLAVGLDALHLFKINVAGYRVSGETYFPFTVVYGYYTVEHFRFIRLLGLFREPGILQMFLIWAIFNLRSLGLNRMWIKLVLLAGLAATFSTAGIAILFATYMLQTLMHGRIGRTAVIMLITYAALMYTPFIGIKEKSQTHSVSITDRSSAITNSVDLLRHNPLGVGMYNTVEHNAGINLLAASHMIGLVGFLLTLLVYGIPMLTVADRKRYLVAVAPIVVTSLFSQPLLDAPLVYLMLMSVYQQKETKESEHVPYAKRSHPLHLQST